MDLTLKRERFLSTGIFGTLTTTQFDTFVAKTLEHAYPDVINGWKPKVASGIYICQRHPPNRLPYETFMLQNVPPFQGQPVDGILIHILNYDSESEGCIGVGNQTDANYTMILNSKTTFNSLMDLQVGVQTFQLTIE